MNKISAANFLPHKWKKYPLYKDIVVPLFDHLIEMHEDRFDYISGKYANYLNLDENIAKELIKEAGFEYVLDGLTLNSEDIRVIFGYLKLFHLLKGSNDGFKVVLDLLGYDYEHLEWFKIDENTSYTRQQLMDVGYLPIDSDPYTFKVVLNLMLDNLNFEQLKKLKNFSRHYIYSVLALFLKLSFDLAELDISFAGFIDQHYGNTSMLSTMGLGFGGFMDQKFKSPDLPPLSFFEHDFFNALEDNTLSNNDYIERINNVSLTYLYEHQFMYSNSDTNGSNHYIEKTDDIYDTSNATFEHTFEGNNNDNSINNNIYIEKTDDIYDTSDATFEHKFLANNDDSSINNNDYIEQTITLLSSREVVINANTILNINFDNWSLDNTISNKYTPVLVGTFTKSFDNPSSLVENTTMLNTSGDFNLLETGYSTDFIVKACTVDIAFKFLSIKNTNCIMTCYDGGYDIFKRRWLVFYEHSNNRFLIDLHESDNNGSNYIRYATSSFTCNTSTNYLMSLAVDVDNDLVRFSINGVDLTLTYVQGNITNITSLNWSTISPPSIPLRIGAYRGGAGFNDNTNIDLNANVFRFAFHTEYRNLATHTQSYNNLFT